MVVIGMVVVTGIAYSAFLFTRVSRAFEGITPTNATGILGRLQSFTQPAEKKLRGETDDRMNVLILGIGGEGHEGSQLADTIVVASFKPSTKQATLFSIPRDFIVDIPNYGFRKINHANAFGEEAGPRGSGAELTSSILSNVLSAPIHYFVRVDFSGFEDVINDLGGIDVDVERAFVDYEYPTEDFGYQTIRFAAGRQRFDGATALKYVRSRHGTNNEGSDFARSRRQQKVIVAVKERAFSLETILNPSRITSALETLGEHIQTSFAPWELLRLAQLVKDVNTDAVINRSLDTTPEGLLVSSVGIDGAYILEPRNKDYSEIRLAFANLFETASAQAPARVEIQNGTQLAGLAARTAETLAPLPVTITRVRNADRRDYERTVVYDLTDGEYAAVATELKSRLGADVVTPLLQAAGSGTIGLGNTDINASISYGDTLRALKSNPSYADVDFVIVLGSDQATER